MGSRCNYGEDLSRAWHLNGNQIQKTSRGFTSKPFNVTGKTHGETSEPSGKEEEEPAQDDQYDAFRRCNFKGNRLRVAVSPQPPFVDCQQDLYGDWLCNGSNIELIRVLERRFNFVADWVVIADFHDDHSHSPEESIKSSWQQAAATSRDAQPVESVANGVQMSAVVGMVAAGRAMLSANGFMATIDRSTSNLVVSEPFDKFQFHLLLSKPVRDHDHIFIKPFRANAWLAILGSACLLMPVFYLLNTSSAYYALDADDHLKSVSLSDCWRCVWMKFSQLIWRSMSVCALRRDRSLSLTPSDLAIDREVNLMVMVKPKVEQQRHELDELPLSGFAMRQETTIFSFTMLNGQVPPGMAQVAVDPQGQLEATRTRDLKLAQHRWKSDRRRWRRAARRKTRTGFFNFAYCVWYVVASLSNQGGETEDLPRANSTRVLIAFWWLYLIVICAIHSGILTAILTFPKEFDFIDNYLNLKPAELTSLHLAVDTHSELAHLLVNSDNLHKSSLQLLKEHQIPVKYVNFRRHRQRILDSIQAGKTTLIEEKSTIKQIITREYYDSRRTKCLFKSSRYPVDVIPMSLLFSARLELNCIEQMDLTLNHVMRSGLAKKWRRKFESAGNDCLNSVEINAGDVDKIELRHVVLAFWLLAIGSLLGLVFLIGEVVWLFTIGDEDDELYSSYSTTPSSTTSRRASSTSLSSSFSNNSDEPVRLGFRRALMPAHYQLATIRSFRAHQVSIERLIKRGKRIRKELSRAGHQRRQRCRELPQIVFTSEPERGPDVIDNNSSSNNNKDDDDDDEPVGLDQIDDFQGTGRFRGKRSRRSTREAERRAKRIQRTLDLLKRVHGGRIYSDRLKRRIRRFSHSVIEQLSLAAHHHHHHHHNHHHRLQGGKRPSILQQVAAFGARKRSRIAPEERL